MNGITRILALALVLTPAAAWGQVICQPYAPTTTVVYGPPLISPPRVVYQSAPVQVIPAARTSSPTPVTQLACDHRRQPVSRPPEIIPILPPNVRPAPRPSRPTDPVPPPPQTRPTPKPQPNNPTDCCDELIERLKRLEAKVENLKATAELDPASVDALAIAVAAKLDLPDTSQLATKADIQALVARIEGLEDLELPDLGGLATKDDIAALTARLDQLATKQDVQAIAATQTSMVALLERLVEVPTLPAPGPGEGDPHAYRELAILIQRNAQTLDALSTRVDLLVRNLETTSGKVNAIELAVQSHTVQLQRLTQGLEAVNTTLGDTDTRIDEIENELRAISVRLQRVEGSTTGPLTEAEKQQRIDEMIIALSEVLGGKIRLRLKFDPATGEITGAEQF